MRCLIVSDSSCLSPFEAPFICSSYFPSLPWERKETSPKTFERKASGMELKTEVAIYFSQALQERGLELEPEN